MGVVRSFSTSTNKWSVLFQFKDKKQIFQGRYGHSACLSQDEKSVLIFGGIEDETKNDVIMFDLDKNVFKRVTQSQQ